MEKGEIGEILETFDISTDNEKRGFIKCLFILKNQEISKLKGEIENQKETIKQLNEDMQNY